MCVSPATALVSHGPAAGRAVVHPTIAPSGRLLWQDILQVLGTHGPLPVPARRIRSVPPARLCAPRVRAR
ncbi:hypothetical protein ACIQCD_04965 [Streptomyces sp. NPDC093250]|uniref:hypothetical protein n=1 Tax=unclassified Streptomyces TaxID=2593676 RepID=UPI0034397A9D